MTEKQFWQNIDETLTRFISESDKSGEDFLRKFVKLLISKQDELLKMEPEARKKFLRRIFLNAGYADYWKQVQEGFDKLLAFQNKYWDDNITKKTFVSRNHERLLALEQIRFEAFGKLGKSGVAALEKAFTEAVKKNLTRKELEKNLRGIGGKVGTYSKAIADTSLRGWDRSVTSLKADLAEVQKATFDGPALLPTSHQFCVEHYKQTYTLDEIDGLSNGQLDPVRIYGGGYRCRHRWRYRIRGILK